MDICKYFLGIGRLYMVMSEPQTNRNRIRPAITDGRLPRVPNDKPAPLTSADVMRELKKQALDVYGTRAKFAEAIGEHDATIGRYLRGERQMPANVLMNAIEALGVSPEVFFLNARETREVPPKSD